MSGPSILLIVGASTLIAALLVLSVYQLNSAKVERRINRRSRTLEGPVPGHRSLSSIGLYADSARSNRAVARQGLYSSGPAGLRNSSRQTTRRCVSTVQSTPSPARHSQLSSLQTIRARSAALEGDGRTGKPAMVKPMTPARMSPAQRRPSTAVISPAPGMDPLAQTVDPRTAAPMRGQRADVQPQGFESLPPGPGQPLSDALAGAAGLDAAGDSGPSGVHDPASHGLDVLDMLARMSEAEAGIQGLVDDLSLVDGGQLLVAAQGADRKSRP